MQDAKAGVQCDLLVYKCIYISSQLRARVVNMAIGPAQVVPTVILASLDTCSCVVYAYCCIDTIWTEQLCVSCTHALSTAQAGCCTYASKAHCALQAARQQRALQAARQQRALCLTHSQWLTAVVIYRSEVDELELSDDTSSFVAPQLTHCRYAV
jgi:hypothetical protein